MLIMRWQSVTRSLRMTIIINKMFALFAARMFFNGFEYDVIRIRGRSRTDSDFQNNGLISHKDPDVSNCPP